MDTLKKAERSQVMSRVRSRGNKSTELKLVRLLRQGRITGWRRGGKVFGNPDFVFPQLQMAVFVDGCFWHGCPKCYRRPKSRRKYWDGKVAGNIVRDQRNRARLRRMGWRVLRIWEHELVKSPANCVAKLRRKLAAKR